MKKPLIALLDAMDEIYEQHVELGDTAVRERMREVIENALLAPVAGYVIPDEFGLFEPEGDAKVKAALARFIEAARGDAAGLTIREDRLLAFQDVSVESGEGNTYDEYFGYDDSAERA